MTRKRVAILLVFCAIWSTFSWPVAIAFDRGSGTAGIAVMLLRVFAGLCIALFPAALLALGVYNRMRRRRMWLRVGMATCALAAATVVSAALALRAVGPLEELVPDCPFPPYIWLVQHVLLFGVIVAAVVFVTRADDTARLVEAEELRAAGLDRALAEARLQATQAQIEPHFLFNTLANVRRLYQVDATAARAMLAQFGHLLAAALPRMRDERSTLGRELALAEAYLAVQKIRMGERLAYATDVPARLLRATLPPMMLSTLVENAIKHGLAPLREGGHVRIAADAEGGLLRIRVADTGRGLTESAGAGVGLANIEMRLAAEFGAAAALLLDANAEGGITATLELPLHVEPAPQASRDVSLVA